MRETRPSGSVRGVRSDPYPYRDNPYTPCAARQKTSNPATALREHEKATPSPRPNRHTPRSGSAADQDRKAPLIGPGSRPGSAGRNTPESGTDRHPQTARPRHTPARPEPNPRLKEKLPEHPSATGAPALTSPAPDRSPCPA